jgi:hypothetical protein
MVFEKLDNDLSNFDNWSERKRRRVLSEEPDWKGHKWKRITRKHHYTYWVCKGCKIKCQRDSHILDLSPNPNCLPENLQYLSCEEIVVLKVMDA